ncbi:MAG TPA: Trm112 family protein [Saccharospirillum sp.]|nr:Trm112 family protein [Saccharospirillum sp.]
MDKQMLNILVCPVTKAPLQIDREKEELISTAAKLAYPIRDGIPVMLEDVARVLSQEEYEHWLSKKSSLA